MHSHFLFTFRYLSRLVDLEMHRQSELVELLQFKRKLLLELSVTLLFVVIWFVFELWLLLSFLVAELFHWCSTYDSSRRTGGLSKLFRFQSCNSRFDPQDFCKASKALAMELWVPLWQYKTILGLFSSPSLSILRTLQFRFELVQSFHPALLPRIQSLAVKERRLSCCQLQKLLRLPKSDLSLSRRT